MSLGQLKPGNQTVGDITSPYLAQGSPVQNSWYTVLNLTGGGFLSGLHFGSQNQFDNYGRRIFEYQLEMWSKRNTFIDYIGRTFALLGLATPSPKQRSTPG